MCRRSELTALVRCPLRCWCHGTMALYQKWWLEMSTKATCFTQRASLCHKNARLACQTSKMNCVLIFFFYYYCDSTSHNELWIHQSREAEPHVSPLCLCCRRDGPSIMCSESDCQHITAVLTIRCGGVVKSWALSVTCHLLLQNTSSF